MLIYGTTMEMHMAPRDGLRRYAYWSERRVRQLAQDNDIVLDRRLRWNAKLKIPFLGEVAFSPENWALDRNEIARRVQKAVGEQVVSDFVTPPPTAYAKGAGRVVFSKLVGVRAINEPVVAHTIVNTSDGRRVDVCMFGSLENMAGYAGADDRTLDGWVSSAEPAIYTFLKSRCTANRSQWDDAESISMEALKIASSTGSLPDSKPDKPWTRGHTLSHVDEAEWFMEVYSDVELDKNRWTLDEPTDRIIIGAPLWIRTPNPQSVTRYQELRRKAISPAN